MAALETVLGVLSTSLLRTRFATSSTTWMCEVIRSTVEYARVVGASCGLPEWDVNLT